MKFHLKPGSEKAKKLGFWAKMSKKFSLFSVQNLKTVGIGIEVGSTWDFFAKTWKNFKNLSEKGFKSQKFSKNVSKKGLKVQNFSKICLKKA